MLNFIKADVRRVLKKKSYIILSAFVLVLYAATLLFLLKKSPDSGLELAGSVLRKAAVLFIGIPVFNAVFTDDFNSKAMQTIIGFGTSRKRLVISRYCEYLVILAQAFLVISALCLALCLAAGHPSAAGPLHRDLWEGYLITALSVNAAMMFVYGTQNPTVGLVVFICLIADVFDLVLTGISLIPFLVKHNIDPSLILPSNMLNQAMHEGKPIFYLIAFLCYVVLPLIISVKAFEKKELEF